jgi:hypothetical protein
MAQTIVRLEGRKLHDDKSEWGTIKDFSSHALFDKAQAIKEANVEATEWYLNYAQMETRVVVEKR